MHTYNTHIQSHKNKCTYGNTHACTQLTPHSLYAAVSVGLDTETIISVLNRLSKVRFRRLQLCSLFKRALVGYSEDGKVCRKSMPHLTAGCDRQSHTDCLFLLMCTHSCFVFFFLIVQKYNT
jgi:hypothetical protein